VSDWAREGCHTLPWDLPMVLGRFGGLKTEPHYYFSDAGFEGIVAESLQKHHPLIVLIQATKGHFGLHWMSVWGYDAKRKLLLAYDSQYASRAGGIGNTTYSMTFLESRFPWWITAAVEVDD
jgi:hypothetical protein